MTEHIDNYDEKTVDEVKEAVRDGGLDESPGTLGDIYEYEHEHKHRVTLLSWLEGRADDLYEEAADDESDEAGEEAEAVADEKITVSNTRTGRVANMWFDTLYETREVKPNVLVLEALEEGDLREENP